jgi:predicted GNAT family acetyltransferase
MDVLPDYRGRGIAAYLVTLLKEEIIKRGRIPYYSTSQSNIYSQNIAMNCGFFPAWVEAYSTEDIEY